MSLQWLRIKLRSYGDSPKTINIFMTFTETSQWLQMSHSQVSHAKSLMCWLSSPCQWPCKHWHDIAWANGYLQQFLTNCSNGFMNCVTTQGRLVWWHEAIYVPSNCQQIYATRFAVNTTSMRARGSTLDLHPTLVLDTQREPPGLSWPLTSVMHFVSIPKASKVRGKVMYSRKKSDLPPIPCTYFCNIQCSYSWVFSIPITSWCFEITRKWFNKPFQLSANTGVCRHKSYPYVALNG